MKILIIGEYSGFAKHLSCGFKKLGHKSFVFSWGDGFKKIEQDEDSYYVNTTDYRIGKYTLKNSNRIRNRISGLKLYHFIRHMETDWDCAIIINFGFIKPSMNPLKPFINILEIKRLLKDEKQIYLSACGGDFIYYNYILRTNNVSNYEFKKAQSFVTKKNEHYFFNYLPHVKGIIPIMVDYEDAYKYYKDIYNYKLYNIIPLPFDISSVKQSFYKGGKIKIMHGVNRFEAKGSNYIIPAMERIKNDFPDLVDLEIVWRIPLKEYLKKMENTNIMIDQCFCESAGMNAIQGLAMGKVVLGGNTQKNESSLYGYKCPIINIKPDEDYIYAQLKDLILNPEKIKDLSIKSYEYACKVYECKEIAIKYIELFKNETTL